MFYNGMTRCGSEREESRCIEESGEVSQGLVEEEKKSQREMENEKKKRQWEEVKTPQVTMVVEAKTVTMIKQLIVVVVAMLHGFRSSKGILVILWLLLGFSGHKIFSAHILASPSIDTNTVSSIDSPSPRQLPLARQTDYASVKRA
ncbi:hypothetical protein DY000_02040528 [Brassica cretica]|uniref:Transmembrane protein n=1 Tax=Brassica cretica TaxID=69181 RepID=A0ABQ7BKN1_BRACR|nr:hypothetical protein DY000_02040528 [Brassica cretica]